MSSIVILSIVLAVSLIFNGLMYWYSRQLTQKLSFIYDNIGDVSELITNYRTHLKSVYSMDMFYGDETLQQLIRHSKDVIDSINRFKNLFEIENDKTEKETEEN